MLPAFLQPVQREDVAREEGHRLSDRLTIYVPTGIERRLDEHDTVTFRGRALLLRGEPLTFQRAGALVPGDVNPLSAAFEDRNRDEVVVAGLRYVVEESVLWAGSHARAILLRET